MPLILSETQCIVIGLLGLVALGIAYKLGYWEGQIYKMRQQQQRCTRCLLIPYKGEVDRRT